MKPLSYRSLHVKHNPNGEPGKLYLPDRAIDVVQVLECWCDTGCWWEGESEKLFYRLYCQEGRVFEIFQDRKNARWFLYKVYD